MSQNFNLGLSLYFMDRQKKVLKSEESYRFFLIKKRTKP